MSEVMTERYAKIAAAYEGCDALTLGKAMIRARIAKDQIEAQKAVIEAEYDFLTAKLPEVMTNEGLSKFSIRVDDPTDPDGIEKRIRFQEEINVSATQESGAASRIIDILKDSGNAGLVKETVAPATLKKFVGDLRKKGESGMPDPVLMQMLDAGMTLTARDRARFY